MSLQGSSQAEEQKENTRLALIEADGKEKWFHPEKERSWHKEQKASTRRRNLLESTDKRKDRHERYLEAARAAGSLANVTQDDKTKSVAQSDADYFYGKAKQNPN